MLSLFRHCRIATCDQRSRVLERGAVLVRDGVIEWVGDEHEAPAGLRPDHTVELAGRWLTPGLVDCHTHLVFAGQRAAEFARRTAGSSYADIAREDGGILGTVRDATISHSVRFFGWDESRDGKVAGRPDGTEYPDNPLQGRRNEMRLTADS